MQRTLAVYNADKLEEEKVLLCVGLGFGKVLRIGDADVFGAEVNATSKLGEDIAKAWEILVTDTVKTRCAGLPGISFAQIDEVPPGAERAWRVEYPLR
jgi:class 3 adenylate cyclase